MAKYIEINLEEGFPTVKEAIKQSDEEIERYKKLFKVIIFIHGYGSSGVGGKIQSSLRTHLKTLKEKKIIKDFIPGEKFGMFDALSRELNNNGNDFKKYYNLGNNGITIVLL